MENLRILIADDDAGMRLVLKALIAKCEGYELCGEAADGEALMRLYERERPDVVFMDVEMPGLTGVECAKRIQDENPKTVLVFATAHEQYMRSAFEVYAFDYLVKPFRNERVTGTLALIRQRLRESAAPAREAQQGAAPVSGRMMLRHRDGLSFIDVSSILLIQREDRASVLYLEGGERYVTGDTLSELDERLPDGMFFRCHKSYIVNLNRISSISPYGRWTSIVKLSGTDRDALITHDKLEQLQKMFM